MTSSTSNSMSSSAIDAEQDRMMEECCILVDDHDHAIGHATKRVCHAMHNIQAGMLHRAFSVFLFDSQGRLLLQQRAACKVTFPLHWTNTCCSHPLFSYNNEEEETEARGVKRAAIRKLEHELGIHTDIRLSDLHWLTKIHYGAASDDAWGEHEIDWILFTQSNLTHSSRGHTHQITNAIESDPTTAFIPFNPNECAAIRYVTPQELHEMITQWKLKQLLLTPWFALIAEKLLFGWWNRLNQIIADGGIGVEERAKIYRLQEETDESQKHMQPTTQPSAQQQQSVTLA